MTPECRSLFRKELAENHSEHWAVHRAEITFLLDAADRLDAAEGLLRRLVRAKDEGTESPLALAEEARRLLGQ